MISADSIRKRTQERIRKTDKITWHKIKKEIKKQSKLGKYDIKLSALTKEQEEVLIALGYTVIRTICYSGGLPLYYRISWEHPQEYWNNNIFDPD